MCVCPWVCGSGNFLNYLEVPVCGCLVWCAVVGISGIIWNSMCVSPSVCGSGIFQNYREVTVCVCLLVGPVVEGNS